MRVVLAALACAPFATAAVAQSPEGCRLTGIGTATVRGTADGGIALEDGRILRLAGIEPSDTTLPPGTTLTLKRTRAKGETDRYGRMVAQVFVMEGNTERWLQADLVGRGLARVAARVGDAACAKALRTQEQSARAAKLGVWGEPYYVIAKADEPAELLRQRGQFALVEGKVLSVRESGGTIYVNFGRRWSEDFTVTIAKRNERMFTAAGLTPKSLEGRRLRVRGWIEERGGPWVEAAGPEQIEVLERD